MNPYCPTEEELRDWAYSPDSVEPVQDWGLVLSWQMDRGLLRRCVQFADDGHCPQAAFFLDVLFQWVDGVVRGNDFAERRGMYDEWLDVAKGLADPVVKRWRHHARMIFQGLQTFDRQNWWELGQADKPILDGK